MTGLLPLVARDANSVPHDAAIRDRQLPNERTVRQLGGVLAGLSRREEALEQIAVTFEGATHGRKGVMRQVTCLGVRVLSRDRKHGATGFEFDELGALELADIRSLSNPALAFPATRQELELIERLRRSFGGCCGGDVEALSADETTPQHDRAHDEASRSLP